MSNISYEHFSITNIKNNIGPVYLLGVTTKTSIRLLQELHKHNIIPDAIWDENWQVINYSDKYSDLRNSHLINGYAVTPVPIDMNAIPKGTIFVADEERFQRKWIEYCKRSYHMVYDAQDAVLWSAYDKCISQNAGNTDLLKCCRNCEASYRSCPVREKWQEDYYGMKSNKVIRHLAVKAGYICNLRCSYCCEFLPRFDDTQKKTFNSDEIVGDIQKLSHSLEYIHRLSFSGGDVMLNKGLAEVIHQTMRLKNIGDIYALTNGTYIPHKDILDAIEENHDRIRIVINNYPMNKGAEKLVDELKKRHITYHIRDNSGWYDLNNLNFRNRNVNELRELYHSCSFDNIAGYYHVMMEGKLNLRCGVANGILYYLDKYDECIQDYIDIRKLNSWEIPDALTLLENRDYLNICNYCTSSRVESRVIVPAENQN